MGAVLNCAFMLLLMSEFAPQPLKDLLLAESGMVTI